MDEKDQTKSIDLVAYGGTIKALGDGRIGGYLVMWGDKQQTDLEGEYFTPETELMWSGEETRPHLYNHGLDETLNGKTLGNGWRKVKVDEVGLWVETQLDLRDEYEKAIYGLVTKSKLGLSSGTASHMVIRENGYIKRWPIVEGSTTPTPAEPRIVVEPIKSAQLNSFKSLCESEPATGNGRRSERRPEAGGKPTKSKPRTKSNGATKMDQLLEAIRQLVPNLTEEQLTQLAAVLQLHGGTVAPEPEAMMAEEDDEPYPMQATRSTGKYRNPKNAPRTTAQVVAETLKAMGIAPQQPAQQPAQSLTQEQIAQITDALKAAGFIPQAQDSNGAKTTPARPPYNFNPATPQSEQDKDKAEAAKSVAFLRFGETPAAVKGIAKELYGDDYEGMRVAQHKSFNVYVRYGRFALNADDQKVLKTVILTPSQIKSMVKEGVDVSSIKTEMSQIIDTLGGFLIPEDMRLDMIERLPGMTVVRSRADVSPTSSDVMTKVKVTGGDDRRISAMRVTWVGDTPAQNQADTAPTFGLEKTPIHIAKITVPVPLSLLEDTVFPLTQKLSEWAAIEYAIDEDEQFLIGNGIAKPEGILPNSVNLNTRLTEVVNGSTSAISADKLIALKYKLRRQYRDQAVWLMNDDTAAAVSQLKGGDGHYLWINGLQDGEPDRLLGLPVETSEAMPAIASNAYPIALANLQQGYQIADRIGMSLLRDEITEAEQDIVKFMFRRRLGGQVKGEWAIVVLKMATN